MSIKRASRITAAAGKLFRKRALRRAALAVALGLGCTSTISARQPDSAAETAGNSAADRALPQIKTHAPAGFRLYRPGYRLAGKGVLVSVQLCRLPGWAAASPQRLRVERLGPAGEPGENHEHYLARLGGRIGANCTTAALHLDAVPTYGESIKICAVSGRDTCP